MDTAEIEKSSQLFSRETGQEDRAIEELRLLAQATATGDLSVRIKGQGYAGAWNEAFGLVNSVIDNLTGPIAEIRSVVGKMSVNDFTAKIQTPYKGVFGELTGELNGVVDKFTVLEATAMEVSQGNLSRLAEFKRIGNGAGRRSENDRLVPAFIQMMENQKLLVDWMERMYGEHKEGNSDFAIDASQFHGAYRTVAESINAGFAVYIDAFRAVLDIITAYAEGDFSPVMRKLPGRHALINEKMDLIRGTLLSVGTELGKLGEAALEGHLDYRADASKYQGNFHEIIQTVEKALDAVIKPIQEATVVLGKLAQNDLTARVQTDYKGDHAIMKNSLNSALDNLNDLVIQVMDAAEQVGSASNQISTSAQAVAEGASEQASSLEEISSSLEEITGMTKNNSGHAANAQGLAANEEVAIEQGMQSVEHMNSAIHAIKESSDETAKIVKTIDEIAFQTNLLALNAAVEAARAGDAGRGFAVVAEEVRNLALRSAEAAKNTTRMIEESVKKADYGVDIVKEVNAALQKVTDSARKVNELVGEIAAASEEQAKATEQVATATVQMDKVTQQNASNAEESASASEELSSQASLLSEMVNRFKVSRDNTRRSGKDAGEMLAGLTPETLEAILEQLRLSKGREPRAVGQAVSTMKRPKLAKELRSRFPLDESELKEF